MIWRVRVCASMHVPKSVNVNACVCVCVCVRKCVCTHVLMCV